MGRARRQWRASYSGITSPPPHVWNEDAAVVDCFPGSASIKDITSLLSSVGFSSPPSWLKPYHVLSNGEKFRVDLVRTLSDYSEFAVVDEFTSVVDRQVAQIGSAALAKTVRRRGGKFVAVTCHYDVLDWLEPDWVYQPHLNDFDVTRGRLRRPEIALTVRRVEPGAWRMFRQHHYLSHSLSASARCFGAFYQKRLIGFAAVTHFPHPTSKHIKRIHRCVILPDFQGVGIARSLCSVVAGMVRGIKHRLRVTTSHPGMIRSLATSGEWKMDRRPSRTARTSRSGALRGSTASNRLTASLEYTGPAMQSDAAISLWTGER